MNITPSLEMVAVLSGAVMLSMTGTWLVLRKCTGVGVDRPDQRRKTHDIPTLRLGGLPIFVTLMAGFALSAIIRPEMLAQWWPVILTNVLIFAIGFLDDLRPLGARV